MTSLKVATAYVIQTKGILTAISSNDKNDPCHVMCEGAGKSP